MTGTHHTTHKSISISSDDFCKKCCRTLLNKWLSKVLPVVSLTRADFVSDKTPLYIIVLFQHVIWERRSVPANGKGEGKQKSSRYFRPEKIGKILQRKKNKNCVSLFLRQKDSNTFYVNNFLVYIFKFNDGHWSQHFNVVDSEKARWQLKRYFIIDWQVEGYSFESQRNLSTCSRFLKKLWCCVGGRV